MKVGVVVFPADGAIRVEDLARAVEDRGFESLFFPEHLHMPVHRTVGFAIDKPLPEVYMRTHDALLSHAVAATVTEHLVLGTSITLVAQRDPILLAKELATLDQIARGRLVVGVGGGWNIEEMRNHGVDPDRRWARVKDHVLAMRTIWADEVSTYHGEFVDFDEIWSWPKPWQGRQIPILIGSGTALARRRALSYGDGWLPALDYDIEPMLADLREFRQLAIEAGRPDAEVTLAYGYGRLPTDDEIEQLAQTGVTRVLLAMDALPYAETLEALDALQATARAAT